MIEPTTTVRRSPRATFRRLDDGSAVVLHLDTAQYHGVNEVGAVIWELTEPAPSFEALVAAVGERVEDPPADLEADVEEFVYALKERGLIDLVSSEA
jgi:Coenzyme PQQ synthesis protein D (PqqD)